MTKVDKVCLANSRPVAGREAHDVHTFHGFNVDDSGEATLDQLDPWLSQGGRRVVDWDREKESLLDARMTAGNVARAAASYIRQQVDYEPRVAISAVGHSHGCNIIRLLSHLPGVNLLHAVLINPAIRVDADIKARHIWCFHSAHDAAVLSSLALRVLPWNWFWRHPWGAAGRWGMNPEGRRNVHNIDLEHMMPGLGEVRHSDAFRAPLRSRVGAKVNEILQAGQ
jgi:hypothetical protein